LFDSIYERYNRCESINLDHEVRYKGLSLLVTVLITEDDEEIAQLISMHLQNEGYKTLLAHDGQAALDMISVYKIDLIIMDIMIPKIDGLEVTKKIREQHEMPIIFLSAKVTDLDKITGLIMGADDYMTKPFNPMELVARVKAQLRRYIQLNKKNQKDEYVIEQAGIYINSSSRVVKRYNQDIELTPKEFDILFLLASHPQKVFSAENIFSHVWGESYLDGANTVMVHIRTLRKKLGEDKNKWIKTIWGVGYSFNG